MNPCQVLFASKLGIQGGVKKHYAVKVNQPINNNVCELQIPNIFTVNKVLNIYHLMLYNYLLLLYTSFTLHPWAFLLFLLLIKTLIFRTTVHFFPLTFAFLLESYVTYSHSFFFNKTSSHQRCHP